MRGEPEKARWRRTQVLGDAAWKPNIEALLSDGPFHLVCVTGDIANTGQPDEYEEATDFISALLTQLGLERSRLFVVPGNHDIDRNVKPTAWRALRKGLPLTDPLATSQWFAGGALPVTRGLVTAHRDRVLERQQAYREWIRSGLERASLLPEHSPHKRLGYRETFVIEDWPFPVHVIGFDSAWLSGDDHDAENLRLTEDQVMLLTTDEKGNELPGLRLGLIHHPLHSLADHDVCQPHLARHIDLLLRGHLHSEDTVIEQRPDHKLLQLAAGCLFEGGKKNTYPNSCQAITLTLDARGRPRRVEIRFRTWSPKGHWHDDPSRHAAAPNGRLRWSLQTTASAESWKVEPAPSASDGAGILQLAANMQQAGNGPGYETLLDGIRTLPAGREIRRFLVAYLGTPERPEPFGGRASEAKQIHEWLNSEGPPCMVLTAPAGCGKSALLCRMLMTLTSRSDLAIVFFPISIRYQTNLESSCIPTLIARLCHLHGESAPALEHTSPQQWRILLDQYLTRPLADGRQLFVVIDGLDEAGDWQVERSLFPAQLGTKTRILVAARTRAGETDSDGWRRQLGWLSSLASAGMTLSGLSVDGVAEAVASLGMPLDRVAERSELIVQIHRLSRGEPLLVQLWCYRLWEQGKQALHLSPEQLRGYPPGLKGYLQEFWDSRSASEKSALRGKAPVQLVLEILASALGPLNRDDLLRLAPELRDIHGLREAIAPLSRFVIGDGIEQGYVLWHSLLRDYLREQEMTESQRRERDERFLVWGQEAIEGLSANRIQPKDISQYLLRYYGSHLHNAGSSPEQRLRLVSNAWRQAWETLENGAGGFLHDVQRAWDAAVRADHNRVMRREAPIHLAAMVRCAVCVAATGTLYRNIYHGLVERMVKHKVWTVGHALAFIGQMNGSDDAVSNRAHLLHFLVPRLPDELMKRALDIAVDIASGMHGKSEPLLSLSTRLAQVCPHEAVAAIRAMARPYERLIHLAAIAGYLPPSRGASILAEILTEVRDEKNRARRASWLHGLIRYFPESERADLLQEVARDVLRVEELKDRAALLRWLLPELPKRLRPKLLTALFDTVLKIDQEDEILYALGVINAFSLPTMGRILRQVEAHKEGPAAIRRWAFDSSFLGSGLSPKIIRRRWGLLIASIGQTACDSWVRTLIQKLGADEPWPAITQLQSLVPILSQEELRQALDELRGAPTKSVTAHGLCLLGPRISPELSLEGLSLILELEGLSEFEYENEVRAVLNALPRERLEEAAALVAAASSREGKAWTSFVLAFRYKGKRRAELIHQAWTAAQKIPSAKKRGTLLLRLLWRIPPAQRLELLGQACDAACENRSRYTRISKLCELAQSLKQPYCDVILKGALEQMPKLEKNYRPAAVLKRLLEVPQISEELKAQVLDEALRACRMPGRRSTVDLTDLSDYAQPEQRRSLLIEAYQASRQLNFDFAVLQTAAALKPGESLQRSLLAMGQELQAENLAHIVNFHLWPSLGTALGSAWMHAYLAAARSLPESNLSRTSYLANALERLAREEQRTVAQEVYLLADAHLDNHLADKEVEKAGDDDDAPPDYYGRIRVLHHVLPRVFHLISRAQIQQMLEKVPTDWIDVRSAAWACMEEPRRGQLLADELARARALPESERGGPLAQVAVRLPEIERSAGIFEALREARLTRLNRNSHRDNRKEVLLCVAPYTRREHVPAFSALIASLYEEPSGAPAAPFLTNLLAALPADVRRPLVDHLLSAMAAWPAQHQDQVILSCADLLPDHLQERFISALPRISNGGSLRPLEDLLPRLPERMLRAALQCLLKASGDFPISEIHIGAIAMVGCELVRRSPTATAEVWQVLMRILRQSAESIQKLTVALQHLAPLLRIVFGASGIDEVMETLLEVRCWWRNTESSAESWDE